MSGRPSEQRQDAGTPGPSGAAAYAPGLDSNALEHAIQVRISGSLHVGCILSAKCKMPKGEQRCAHSRTSASRAVPPVPQPASLPGLRGFLKELVTRHAYRLEESQIQMATIGETRAKEQRESGGPRP